ncbi:tRNA A64-2'-O-ribosylphosphate transferase [Lasiosphaeria hispida]|uniref:tRNA A64-2'-O-ribosylphosphate transferase n=1 Tax=Lasiosphaeria hispida TaxID=260671 RepID=A0AAJ0MIA7_9PEZI|nr:tRNA A64-2'-O-ribosylphosphate transferase [Lasiosphaeria hispida]
MPAPTLSEVIFSDQANHNFSKILGDLKRSNLSITNRLKSIQQDASFVWDVADTLNLPLVANERCGSWYIDPKLKAASAYFKSTDGHAGQWKFSTRRLNLQLLELIGNHDGCIVVDSTRRGKRMPDALSKTVPVWCCILNRALFPDDTSSHRLFVPPNAVSDSEKSQIETRLPEFLDSLEALDLNLTSLREHLKKPLRPLWVTQEDDLSPDLAETVAKSFHPVVCCTSSRQVVGTELSESGYIQGAGDDTENWALGLTAPVFWRHADKLLSTPESDLPDLIASLVAESEAESATVSDVKQVAPCIFVGVHSALGASLASGCCVVSLTPKPTDQTAWTQYTSHIEASLGKGKIASRLLRDALPHICQFVSRFLERPGSSPGTKVVVLCDTDKDLSVGVALALSCWCFDASGNPRPDQTSREAFTKTAIRVKLGHIMTARPDANPSRATLQSVNSFLMDWRK